MYTFVLHWNARIRFTHLSDLIFRIMNVYAPQMWLSYSSVPHFTANFYGVTLDEVDWFSVIFFVVSMVMGLVTIVILDVFGLKAAVSLQV